MKCFTPFFLAVTILLVLVSGCEDKQKIREKLDAEFEKETDSVKQEVNDLEKRMNALIASHREKDKKHDEFNQQLFGQSLSPEDAAKQNMHEEWEKEHEMLISEVQKAIQGFKDAHEHHEEMEKGHENAPLSVIKEEHERFERELADFLKRFREISPKLRTADQQMKTILKEHEEMAARYKK